METPATGQQSMCMQTQEPPRCIICGEFLRGKQRAFCSRRCKNRHTNYHHQSHIRQLERGRIRKLELVLKMGGRCSVCGYARNLAALEFHHREPDSKVLQLDTRTLANRNWHDVMAEADKCLLLCSNCHAEHHNPDAHIDRM
jgi:hypothetical protein